jgi:hypothetical protein
MAESGVGALGRGGSSFELRGVDSAEALLRAARGAGLWLSGLGFISVS